MAKSKHDKITEQIAKKRGGKYNPDKGADIVTSREAIEVEVDASKLSEGIRQLQGYRKKRSNGSQYKPLIVIRSNDSVCRLGVCSSPFGWNF